MNWRSKFLLARHGLKFGVEPAGQWEEAHPGLRGIRDGVRCGVFAAHYDLIGASRIWYDRCWYGLAYLMGFVCGISWNLAKRGLWVLTRTTEFHRGGGVVQVFLGRRLGYILFYRIRRWGGRVVETADGLRVWEGGWQPCGILRLVIFTGYAGNTGDVDRAGDGLCVVARWDCFRASGEFHRSELYGRVADGVAWAVNSRSRSRTPAECRMPHGRLAPRWSQLAEATTLNQLIATARENPEVRNPEEFPPGTASLADL
jgi:hypothetical protein